VSAISVPESGKARHWHRWREDALVAVFDPQGNILPYCSSFDF
jgi:hypothetical protein